MAHASQTCSSSVRQQIMNLSGCDKFTEIRWKGNTSHGSYGLTDPKHQVLCRAVRSDFLPTDHGGCMRGIVPVSCVSGCETSPPVCHMPLASAKPLHANPQYGHKLEGRRCESMGNSAVFGLTEGFLYIVSHAVTTGTGFKMMSALSGFIQEEHVYITILPKVTI